MSHPVLFQVEPPAGERNRLTTLARPILAIPHILLIGGPFLGVMGGAYRTGAFGLLAGAIAVLDWFAILFTGHPLAGLQGLKRMYLGWRARALAYCAMLRDEYPPFGVGPYPATLLLPQEPPVRDRLAVGLRLLLVLPHLLVLMVLLLLWAFAALAAWVMIVFVGRMPAELWRFSHDVMAYTLRVEAYLLLIHDQYPPFALSEQALEAATPLPPSASAVES